jgi:7-cyano-7-deazaguanine synthase
MSNKAVVVISGGLDSSTLLHRMVEDLDGYEIHGISFNYGQRHVKELEYAARQCALVEAEHHEVNMSFLGDLFASVGSESSLINGNVDVPDGHYAEQSMKKTVVPNRNMIMLSIAGGLATALKARILATGVHAGDHFIYPDCRPEFLQSVDSALYKGNQGFLPANFELRAPYMHKSKNDIAADAFRLGVDIAQTWSCYKGGDIHCGTCGTCVERQEAIASTGYEDPTPYADDKFWREALRRETV